MKSVTELKGLGDIRTAVSSHHRSATRHKSTTYFEILSMGIENLRLDTEMAWLAKRQKRIEKRIGEIKGGMDTLLRQVKEHQRTPLAPSPRAGEVGGRTLEEKPTSPAYQAWRKMTVEY